MGKRRQADVPLSDPEVPAIYQPAPPKQTGRLTTYDAAVGAKICERIGEGELTVDICSEEGMPSLGMIHRWRETHPGFREAYARAREQQAHVCAERATKGGRAATAENAAAARVHFDADRWFAGKLLPHTYGERLATQQLDKDGNPTDPAPVAVINVGEMVANWTPPKKE